MIEFNSIPEIQNKDEYLKQLAAQRELYSEAKVTMTWQMILAIGIAVVFSIASILTKGRGIEPLIEKGTALFSMLIALFDVLVLEPRQKRLAQEAAKIQEEFDCSVFELEWNGLKVGDHPEQEKINDKSKKHSRVDPGFSALKNWYSPSVGQVPLAAARILCQRTNAWWDAGLRRRYARVIIFGLPILFILLVGFGWFKELLLVDFIFKALIPFMPAFLWGIREIIKQKDTSDTLDRLHKGAISLWSKALSRELTDEQLTQASRNLQNEIYDHRKSAPFIFNWIYKRLKDKDEEKMNVNAESLVNQYLETGERNEPILPTDRSRQSRQFH